MTLQSSYFLSSLFFPHSLCWIPFLKVRVLKFLMATCASSYYKTPSLHSYSKRRCWDQTTPEFHHHISKWLLDISACVIHASFTQHVENTCLILPPTHSTPHVLMAPEICHSLSLPNISKWRITIQLLFSQTPKNPLHHTQTTLTSPFQSIYKIQSSLVIWGDWFQNPQQILIPVDAQVPKEKW